MFFLGIVSYLALIAVAIYIFIREDNTWLRKTALFAVILAVFFAAVNFVLGAITGLISAATNIVLMISIASTVFSVLTTLVNIAEFVLLLLFGFMALGGKSLNIGFINKLYDKHAN